MTIDSPPSEQSFPLPAILSAMLPGLGQALKRQALHALGIFLSSAMLLGLTWWISRASGAGGAIFFLMLIVLPWWAIQSYDAMLPEVSASWGLGKTVRVVWARAHDIRYLGALFFLTAFTDFYIIVANPEYALTIFCAKPSGLLGILAKAQSPTLHTLIGYGFMRLRRWSLFLYLVYAAFGLLNATANYACFGYGHVRTVFLVTLIGFTVYVLWRRQCFQPVQAAGSGL